MQRLAALAIAVALSLPVLRTAVAGCGPTGWETLPARSASAVKITIRTFNGQPAYGTGVIWDGDGHIVTNDHVAAVGDQYSVTLAGGEQRPARVLAVDGPLPPPAPVAPARTLHAGDGVVAIGNPYGQGITLSGGTVNGFDREVITAPTRRMTGMIETTAPLRPGNSGGPLLSCRGEVVGINTAAVETGPGGATLGFAIPSERVAEVVGRLLPTATTSMAGLSLPSGLDQAPTAWLDRPVPSPHRGRPGLGLYVVRDGGALVVQQVVPGSPAARAGALPGDAIIEANGRLVSAPEDLQSLIRDAGEGTIAILRIVRGGAPLDMAVRIMPVVFAS